MLFALGQTVATPAAVAVCNEHNVVPLSLLMRHAAGDWGQLSKDDNQANVDAIAYGDRIVSSYTVGTFKLYVITEHDRSYTTLMCSHEY